MPKCPVCHRLFKDEKSLNFHFEKFHYGGEEAICEFCADTCSDRRFRRQPVNVGCARESSSVSAVSPESFADGEIPFRKRSAAPPVGDHGPTGYRNSVSGGPKRRANSANIDRDVFALANSKYAKISPKVPDRLHPNSDRRHAVLELFPFLNCMKPNVDEFKLGVAEVVVSTCEKVESKSHGCNLPVVENCKSADNFDNLLADVEKATFLGTRLVESSEAPRAEFSQRLFTVSDGKNAAEFISEGTFVNSEDTPNSKNGKSAPKSIDRVAKSFQNGAEESRRNNAISDGKNVATLIRDVAGGEFFDSNPTDFETSVAPTIRARRLSSSRKKAKVSVPRKLVQIAPNFAGPTPVVVLNNAPVIILMQPPRSRTVQNSVPRRTLAIKRE